MSGDKIPYDAATRKALAQSFIENVVLAQYHQLRLRVWRVAPRTDTVFASVVKKWAKRKSSGNFQLHPPCWQEGSRVTNESGNLELPMIFEAVRREIEGVDFMDIVTWNPNAKKKSTLARRSA